MQQAFPGTRFEPHAGGMLVHRAQRRSTQRTPDRVWQATLRRVRGEFDEMPCLRVTSEQARILFGLPPALSTPLLERLVREGVLVLMPDGTYVRQTTR
jgi:hypothetical protein